MRLRDKARRKTRRTLLLLLAFAAPLVAAGWADRQRNADQEYAAYSAYVSDELLDNAHDWSVGGPVLVVVRDTTSESGNLRLRVLRVLDSRVHLDGLRASTRASFFVRNLYRTRILPKFALLGRATVALASLSEIDSPDFQTKFPRNLGFITLSGVGFNRSQTQAVFYIEHSCGLCGGGRDVLMEKVDGSWRVRDEQYTWIS